MFEVKYRHAGAPIASDWWCHQFVTRLYSNLGTLTLAVQFQRRYLSKCSKLQNFFKTLHPLLKFIYFEKATKFCEICTLLLTGTVHRTKKVKILQNFVVFSEYMTFTKGQNDLQILCANFLYCMMILAH